MQLASAGYVSISPSLASAPPLQVTAVIPVFKVGQYIPDHPAGSWARAGVMSQSTPVTSHAAITSMNAGGAF